MIDKKIILSHCINLLEQRIANAKQAMQEAQEASVSEEKSSAGDKYETGRAMGHLNSEMNAKQLQKAQQELQLLQRIDIEPHPKTKQGSLVQSQSALYFIGIGLGPIRINNTEIITLSTQAPLAQTLIGLQKGDSFTINQQVHTILNVF